MDFGFKMKQKYYDWLREFKKLHGLRSTNQAIYKLIDMYEEKNKRMTK